MREVIEVVIMYLKINVYPTFTLHFLKHDVHTIGRKNANLYYFVLVQLDEHSVNSLLKDVQVLSLSLLISIVFTGGYHN